MNCICRNLPRGTADVYSFDAEHESGVVVRNLGTGPMETCDCCGHRVDPLEYILCQRNDMVSSAIAAGHLQVVDEFSVRGHILSKE